MPKKILIVDDDPAICDSLAIIFRDEGYSVDETTDSGKAAILIKNNRYDVCIFDYQMNGLNGIDLLKMIKGVDLRCPVFIISGMLSIEMLCDKEIKAGVAAVIISKPFDVEALLQRVADVV
jgi:two-component system response regulator FixJ